MRRAEENDGRAAPDGEDGRALAGLHRPRRSGRSPRRAASSRSAKAAPRPGVNGRMAPVSFNCSIRRAEPPPLSAHRFEPDLRIAAVLLGDRWRADPRGDEDRQAREISAAARARRATRRRAALRPLQCPIRTMPRPSEAKSDGTPIHRAFARRPAAARFPPRSQRCLPGRALIVRRRVPRFREMSPPVRGRLRHGERIES